MFREEQPGLFSVATISMFTSSYAIQGCGWTGGDPSCRGTRGGNTLGQSFERLTQRDSFKPTANWNH